MALLSSSQIRTWFQGSLSSSGFSHLDEIPLQVWKNAVQHGKPALPPGFLGILFERLTGRGAGPRIPAPEDSLERELLFAIASGEGFEHLEGIFALAGGSPRAGFIAGVMEQVIDRLPDFACPEIQFTTRDLDEALGGKQPPDTSFPVEAVLPIVYRDALNGLNRRPFKLGQADLFEIGHPHLFRKPADRTFYRRLMSGMRGLSMFARGTFTLREELPMVVARYGEAKMLPLGGYDSLTNKGDIASLVPSELGFIDDSMEVDLFDYKYCENQLLYFKREEGAVFRIRRHLRVHLPLTPFFEHERHLGLLFAWCLVFAERVIETFTKDIVRIEYVFSGFRPTAFAEAGEFLRHFLAEKGNASRIALEFSDDQTRPDPFPPNTQAWVIGPTKRGIAKFVPGSFPQSDQFASADAADQERFLGEQITEILETMVNDSWR